MTWSPKHSVSNYFQRNSFENLFTRLWFRWQSHRNKDRIKYFSDTYLAKIHTIESIAAAQHSSCWSERRSTVRFPKFKFLVYNIRPNSCFESFQTTIKCRNIWQPICMQAAASFYASTRSRLPHRYFWHTLCTNHKPRRRPASVQKCKQRKHCSKEKLKWPKIQAHRARI